MATYNYLLADLLTNQVLAELPLNGVSFGRRLGKAGPINFSFGLQRSGFSDEAILEATEPGRTAIYVDRDGALVYGGIVWSRTWQEQSYSLQMYGESFESFLYREDIRNTLDYVNVDQRNIGIDLVNKMQAYPYRDIGIIVPDAYSTPNILRSTTFADYEAWTFGKAMDYMKDYAAGFDYTIDVRYGTDGQPEKVMYIDDLLGQSETNTQLAFDYPGNVKNYWWPESASKGATTIHGMGAGEGSAMARTVVTDQPKLDAGYPELVSFYSNKDVTVQATLDSKSVSQLAQYPMPFGVPTFETNPNIEPQFGSYQLGDYARVSIESVRFPEGKVFRTRVIGWDVTPQSGETQEQVKLIVAGED